MAKFRKNPTNIGVATKAIRRAIRKSDPTHEPPTVGKPVIIDPVQQKSAIERGGKKSDAKRRSQREGP
jgi:hypothetical protein